jgi:hypothetical protein
MTSPRRSCRAGASDFGNLVEPVTDRAMHERMEPLESRNGTNNL